MLILSRRIGETITIGTDITVSIINVTGNQVRVGVQAPKLVEVYRQEVYERLRRTAASGPETSCGETPHSAHVTNE